MEIDGTRWSLPGDMATMDADGTVHLLGRGSQCINTGGEKVYPEEVEAVLKTAPGVADAVVVGVADERFGERVVAIVAALTTPARHPRSRQSASTGVREWRWLQPVRGPDCSSCPEIAWDTNGQGRLPVGVYRR